MKLANKVVIVTGSSSGIGRATAIKFAEAGAYVVINYHVNEKGGHETLEAIKQNTKNCLLVKADVSTQEGVDQLFDATMQKFSAVDILINNAAIPTDKVDFMDANYADFKEMLDADLMSVFMCSQRAVEIMKKQGSGKILNTSSVRGWEFGGRAPVYAAAKAAVNSFTRTLAKQVAPDIQINAVAPGFVKTRTYDTMPKERLKGFMDQTYLKRWIDVDEIADTFLFLAQNDAITGQVIYVEAGFMLS
jgi:3-oxoacyl-[acyl-carrier protein] reductase